MGKTLYLECTSGISGDMTVAALLDLGASERHLREALATLPVADEFSVAVSRVTKSGLAACDFDVRLDAAHENHDHDMAWLFGTTEHDHVHGHSHEHGHGHAGHGHSGHAGHEHDREHEDGHGHCHDHDGVCTLDHHHDEECHGREHTGHEHDHEHRHHHVHRSLADVTAIIDASGLTPRAKELARAVFGKLAEAEAIAHGATPDTVLFHEVGATDSIVDICSVAVCLDDLDVTSVIVPALSEGHGTIRCAHGIMPVPVPAVVNLCRIAAIELVPAPVMGELVTPTGAAIVAALRTSRALPARFRIEAVGLGAGKRPYENCAGVLRASLIKPVSENKPLVEDGVADAPVSTAPVSTATQAAPRGTTEPATTGRTVTKLETNLDDCTGEALGRVISLLMDAGARDAHAVPVVMKKGRPGYQLDVICDAADVAALERVIFENTTTIGIRSVEMRRDALARTPGEARTPFGAVATKRVVLPDGSVRAYPEYDSVVAACERTGASFQDVFRAAQAGDAADGGTAAGGAGVNAAAGGNASATGDAPTPDAS